MYYVFSHSQFLIDIIYIFLIMRYLNFLLDYDKYFLILFKKKDLLIKNKIIDSLFRSDRTRKIYFFTYNEELY